MNCDEGDKQQAKGLLNSWKEIAVYLGRGVRTVQRWEQRLGLPLHRFSTGGRGPVYAFQHEIAAWLEQNLDARPVSNPRTNGARRRTLSVRQQSLIQLARELRRRASELEQLAAEGSPANGSITGSLLAIRELVNAGLATEKLHQQSAEPLGVAGDVSKSRPHPPVDRSAGVSLRGRNFSSVAP